MTDVPVYPLTIHQGETYSLSIVVKEKATGLPRDLTGYSAKMQIRSTPNGELLNSFSSSGSGITITPMDGKIDLAIPDTETAEMEYTNAVYDCLMYSESSATYLLRGPVRVNPRVTR